MSSEKSGRKCKVKNKKTAFARPVLPKSFPGVVSVAVSLSLAFSMGLGLSACGVPSHKNLRQNGESGSNTLPPVPAPGVVPIRMAQSGLNEAWNLYNSPLMMSRYYKINFEKLPVAAKLTVMPWSDTYWPSNKGGIAHRWNSMNPQNFTFVPPTLEQLKNMTMSERAQLSPAEKYDAFIGRYDYPVVKYSRERTSPYLSVWDGLCHGWAAAATLLPEPKPVVLTGANGIEIPFGASDVKGLLAFEYGEVEGDVIRGLGVRCENDDTNGGLNTPECKDVNAGAFHIVLANQIGLKNQSFIAEVSRDLEVWNHPVHSFKSVVVGTQSPSPGAARATVKEVLVETTMEYAYEVMPNWKGGVRADESKFYKYRLELNDKGDIIGGEWMSYERPDFLWAQDLAKYPGIMSKLADIVKASLQ